MSQRVVITGIGLIAPNGRNTFEVWNECRSGKGTVAPIPSHWTKYASFSSKVWAPLPSIVHDNFFVNRIESMQIDKVTLLTLLAAKEALQHSGLQLSVVDNKKNTFQINEINSSRWGTFVGTGMGGITSFSGAQSNHIAGGFDSQSKTTIDSVLRPPVRFNPFIVSMVMPNASAATLGIKCSLTGTNKTFCQACAAGTASIGEAFRAIQSGYLDGAIAGGADYLADEYGGIMRGFDCAKSLAVAGEDFSKANRPFDEERTGFLFAEGGAGILILESLEHAQKRNCVPIAEITAAAESFDAHSIMAMEPSADAAEMMIQQALEMAGIQPDTVDYINTHGTGTKLNDLTEATLIDRVFGKRPFINSTKSCIGHTIGASGAIEAGITALSIKQDCIHPSLNIEKPVIDLSFVRSTLHSTVNIALTHSFAFGGHNACLVMKKIG